MSKNKPAVGAARMRGTSAPALPPPFEYTLFNGEVAKWRMPDPFSIVAFDGVVPDPLTAATIRLLKEEKSYTHESDPRKFRYDAQEIMGMYGVVSAMLVSPTLNPRVEYGEGDVLGRREIGLKDVTQLYWLFLLGTRATAGSATDSPGSVGDAQLAPDSEGVRTDAGAASGGE